LEEKLAKMNIYAINENTGNRRLVAIECDLCSEQIKPGKKFVESSWKTRGVYYGPGDERNTEIDLCPNHADQLR
jgi:hypothetical protein